MFEKLARVRAASDAAEQGNRDLAGGAIVVVECRRQIGVGGIGEIDLDRSSADTRGGRVALDDEVVRHDDRRCDLPGGRSRSAPESSWASIGRVVRDRGRGAVLPLVAQNVEAGVLVGIELIAERILDGRGELDRVGSAQLLERKTDLELGRRLGGRVLVERRNREQAASTLSDQLTSVPFADRDVFKICKCQVPLAFSPIRLESKPCGW